MVDQVVWVALISAGGALTAAAASQFLSMRAAAKQAARTERQEALQWQRSEAKRKQDLQNASLRELWGHVMVARVQMQDLLERLPVEGQPKKTHPGVSAGALPSSAAVQAQAVALLGLPSVRATAREFYVTTGKLQIALFAEDVERIADALPKWLAALKALETGVAAVADGATDESMSEAEKS